MSSISSLIDPSTLQPLSSSVRQLCQIVIDANASGDQPLMTCAGTTYITAIIIERVSGAALTLAVLKVGFNAGANDIISSQALVGLGSIGQAVEVIPILGHSIGVVSGSLKANMSTLAGLAATLRVTVIGLGG